MSDQLKYAVTVIFAKQLAGGAATQIRTMRALGATTISYGPRSVPIELGLESPEVFDYVGELRFRGGGWDGIVGLAPHSSIAITWDVDTGSWPAADAVFEHVISLGEVDFATCERTRDVHPGDRPRERMLLTFHAEQYVRQGPAALGARSLLGPRLLALLEPGIRDALVAAGTLGPRGLDLGDETWLETEDGRALRRRLADQFEASEVIPSFTIQAWGMPRLHRRGGWVPPPDGAPPTSLSSAALAALEALKQKPAESLDFPGLVAPFANLSSLDVLEIELEGAKLPCVMLDYALLHDVGAVEVDLRGAYAQKSRWLESSLHGADLRYANFTEAIFPVTRLDAVNAAYATFTDAGIVESAVDACFDHVTALRWNPSDETWAPRLTNSTFRHAVLRDAHFDRVKLGGASFDGADLTGVRFTAADLRGASFRGAILSGTTFTGCDLDGAAFDPGVAPHIEQAP